MKFFALNKFLLLITFAALCTVSIKANSPIYFSHLTIDEGLSQSTVYSISQDKTGFMWFATSDGLNRFDGYSFRIFRHQENDSTSIASNITRFIYRDKSQKLWIATEAGLSMYDEEKDRFENYYFAKKRGNSPVNTIIDMGNHNLLVGTKMGLRILDKKNKKLTVEGLTTAMRDIEANCMLKWDDKIFIGTKQGLFVYHIQQRTFEPYCQELQQVKIQSILKQTNSRLWIGTEGNGLYLLNPRNMHLRNYRHEKTNEASISSDFIRSLALDAQNRLWVGTFTELNIYHESTDSFLKYNHNPLDEKSLSHNSIRSIYQDYQGGMWLGTYYGGVNYYHPLRNNFQIIRRIPFANSLSNNIISCIKEDHEGYIWIGTNDGGLNKYNPKKQHFTHFTKTSEKQRLLSNDVKAVHIDKKNDQVFVGTHAGGITIINQKNNTARHLTAENSKLNDNNVYAFLPHNDNHLWVGTLDGLQLFNIEKGTFEKISQPLAHQVILFLHRDKKERIWVGTEKGIRLFEAIGNRLVKLNTDWLQKEITESYINSIHESDNGTYWIATREGLYGVHETKNKHYHYNTENGLPNNVIHAILEDNYGRLWISSNKGLSCINISTETIKNFSVIDRLQSNEFNNYASLKSKSGNMYFGGTKGITQFKPELLMDNPHMPAPIIKRIRLSNKRLMPDDKTGILSKAIHCTDSITLKANQSTFTLNYVVSNYISGQHNLFAYRLKGYEKDWYETEQGQVSYANLPHGHYVFQLKAANNDGRWNEYPTELHITILPVWYKTTWAIISFFLATVLLLVFVVRYFLIKKTMRQEIEMERVKQEKNEEISQMKMRFFINLSHELRTPLTLIMAPLQDVIQRTTDKWTRGQLEHAYRNSMRLLRIVNQLLDYRKAELGVFELKVAPTDLHQVVKNQFLSYEKLARKKQIHYTFSSEIEDKSYYTDENYIEIMVNNLISNAFKYTPEGQKIEVQLTADAEHIQISVSDSGIGIAKSQQDQIFERFYQVDNEQAASGSGIGLSLVKRLVELHHAQIELISEEDKGSKFIITLPVDDSVYSEKEKTQQAENTSGVMTTTSEIDENFLYLNDEALHTAQPAASNVKKGHVLVVEDNDEIRNYLKDGLAMHFDISVASHGEEALEIIKQEKIDLVLTDIMMPVMDGIKLSKAIKQNIRTCHIPVIALSAKSDIKDQLDALQVGVDDYIPKPFSLSVLNMKVQNLMRTRHRIFEHYSKSLEIEPHKISFNAMDEELLNKAKKIVTKNIDNIEFSADDFAQEMGMSRSNLHLKLKAITGESTIEFIRKIRFKKACELLEDGRYSVAEVSTMVGFNTPSYFATSFKKYFGYLPTEYIKNRRG